jgi:hypothetical protein
MVHESNLELWISNLLILEVVGRGSRADNIAILPFDIAHTCQLTDP